MTLRRDLLQLVAAIVHVAASIAFAPTAHADFVAASTATGSPASDQVTIDAPAGLANGHVFGCLTDSWGATVSWGFTPATTGTFSVLGEAGREGHFAWATRIASDEPSTYTINLGGGSGLTVKAVCFALSGRTSATPSASESTNDAGASATPISTPLGGVTAASGDDIVILTGAASSNITGTASFTAPTNYTTRATASLTGAFTGGGVSIATRTNVSSGATGTLTGSWVLTSGHADTAGVVLSFSTSGDAASNAPRAMHYKRLMH